MKTSKKPVRAWLRRGVLAALLIAAAGLAVVRWEAPQAEAPVITPAPTVQAADERTLRETAYDKDVAALQKLIESETTDAETRRYAANQLQKLIDAHQSENAIEDALKKAGYEPCLVLMTGDALTVMLEHAQMDAQTSAAILSLCTAHTGLGAENIRIMGR